MRILSSIFHDVMTLQRWDVWDLWDRWTNSDGGDQPAEDKLGRCAKVASRHEVDLGAGGAVAGGAVRRGNAFHGRADAAVVTKLSAPRATRRKP